MDARFQFISTIIHILCSSVFVLFAMQPKSPNLYFSSAPVSPQPSRLIDYESRALVKRLEMIEQGLNALNQVPNQRRQAILRDPFMAPPVSGLVASINESPKPVVVKELGKVESEVVKQAPKSELVKELRKDEIVVMPRAPKLEASKPKPPKDVEISGERFSLAGLNSKQKKVLTSISKFSSYPVEYIRGTRFVRVGSRKYRDDCSNILRIAYDAVGVDLFSEHHHYPEANGVKLIRKKGETPFASTSSVGPQVGDIVVFNNTFDRNKNGRLDDADTHAAIVLSVEKDGTVAVYNRVASGHRVYRMNIRRPSLRKHPETKQRINHVLRRASKGKANPVPRLTGALFATYVRVLSA